MKKVSTPNERLVELMQAFDITQTDICNKTGLYKSSMSSYVSGRRPLGAKVLTMIGRAYNVSVDWLMGYDTPMSLMIDTQRKEYEDEQALRVARMFASLDDKGKDLAFKILSAMTNEDREEK